LNWLSAFSFAAAASYRFATSGVSQVEVAAAVGINRTYYSLFEAGRYLLDRQELTRLRSFLDTRAGPELTLGHECNASESDDDLRAADFEVADDDQDEEANGSSTESRHETHMRLAVAARTVQNIEKTAAETGLDSRRTAAAVVSATAALDVLDYAELLILAVERGLSLAGNPTGDEFAVLPTLEAKQSQAKNLNWPAQ